MVAAAAVKVRQLPYLRMEVLAVGLRLLLLPCLRMEVQAVHALMRQRPCLRMEVLAVGLRLRLPLNFQVQGGLTAAFRLLASSVGCSGGQTGFPGLLIQVQSLHGQLELLSGSGCALLLPTGQDLLVDAGHIVAAKRPSQLGFSQFHRE